MSRSAAQIEKSVDRRAFIGGSDARIIMGDDEAALSRLWREKRGEGAPEGRSRDRPPQPPLVRAKYRPGGHRGAAPGLSSGEALDGGDAGRNGRSHGCRV